MHHREEEFLAQPADELTIPRQQFEAIRPGQIVLLAPLLRHSDPCKSVLLRLRALQKWLST